LAVCDKKFYPACFAFLPDRKASTYKTFFTEIESMLLEGQGGNGDAGTINLTKFLVDYEAAVMKEVRSIFGANIEISGCWLHFKRNIWTHLRKLPYLASLVCNLESFGTFVKCLGALAFVPKESSTQFYDNLLSVQLSKVTEDLDDFDQNDQDRADEVAAIKDSINDFIGYFESTYIGVQTRTHRKAARFSSEIWSQFSNVVEGSAISTNANESMHANMSKLISVNSKFWAVVDYFKNLEAKVRVRREEHIQYSQGEREFLDRRQSDREGELKNLLSHINDYEPVEYLKRVGNIKDVTLQD
jgi:hypothetical protein